MNQQSLELILDLYKEEKIDKEDAVNIIEDLAGNNYKPYFWTTPSYPNITYYNDVKDPLTPPYTIFANNKAENQNGDNQMPKVQM
jgi:hypothetical protein